MTAESSANRLKASIVDLTFIVWALVVPTLLRSRLFTSDGDFARHLHMGRLILERGPWFVDDLAWTHQGPFVTTEWLSQLSFALADRIAGLAGVAVLVGCVVGCTYALIVRFMLRRGVDPLLAYLCAMLAAVLGAPHWVARPHIFTLLGTAALLNIALTGQRRRSWVFVPFFMLWANFHGGFVIGLAILVVIAVGEWMESTLTPANSGERLDGLRRGTAFARAALLGLAASTINPMGVDLLGRIGRMLGNQYLMATAAEFQSLDFHTGYGKIFLLVIVGAATLLATSTHRPTVPQLGVVLLTLSAALVSGRHAPLFGIAALPLLASHADARWRRLPGRLITSVRSTFAIGESLARPGRQAPIFAVLLAALAMTGGSVASSQVITDAFDSRKVPSRVLDRARKAGLDGRMFNELRWGGYILLNWPEQRIFIDGMTDFLGNDVLASYLRISHLEAGWDLELRDRGISLVIMGSGSRLVHALYAKPEWQRWYSDNIVTILIRRSSAGDSRDS